MLIIPAYDPRSPITYRLNVYDRENAIWKFDMKLPVFHRGIAELAIAADSKTHKAGLYPYFLRVEGHTFGVNEQFKKSSMSLAVSLSALMAIQGYQALGFGVSTQ